MIKPTITIGIPAYNEEANIGYILDKLIKQEFKDFILEKIIVSSDASTDKTNDIVSTYKDKNVQLVENTDRGGQAKRQNQIMEICDSDILVLLNADIDIKNKNFITNLSKGVAKGADLTCGPLFEIEPSNFFERVLATGSMYRRRVFEKYNNGDNLFTCHGSHRAMSKRFYKHFRFEGSLSEDAQSYLFCKQNGYIYKYIKNAVAFIKLPDNLRDHLNQSSRFFTTATNLSKTYETQTIAQYSKWPVGIFFTEGIKLFLEKPIEATIYTLVSVYTILYSRFFRNRQSHTWQTVKSTKIIRGSL